MVMAGHPGSVSPAAAATATGELMTIDGLLRELVRHAEGDDEAFVGRVMHQIDDAVARLRRRERDAIRKEIMMTSQVLVVPQERVLEADYEREDELSLAAALGRQWASAPWYVSSLAIHSLLFLILLCLPVQLPQKPARRIIIECDMIEEQAKVEEPQTDIVERDPEIVTETENPEMAPVVVTTDFEIAEHNETADDMEMDSARGDPDSIATFDKVEGAPALMGIGASGGSGGSGRFGFRSGGGKRNAVARGGGSRQTESAVDLALQWLAEHQEKDGHWDCVKYEGGKMPHGKNGVFPAIEGNNGDEAVTALATLAFLGAGNSTQFGKYQTNVARAVYWLRAQQQANGSIGKTFRKEGYMWAVTTMALSEAYGMSQRGDLKSAAQKTVDWTVSLQEKGGGWDYSLPGANWGKGKMGRDDTSVTGWYVLGLKSAKAAGLHVPYETLEKACKFLQAMVIGPEPHKDYSSGVCKTAYEVYAVEKPAEIAANRVYYKLPRLNAVALTALQFLGRPRTDPQVIGLASAVLNDGLPQTKELDFYRWYYSALGLFQMGAKSEYWQKWNEPMKATLLETQVKAGSVKEKRGSWNPDTDFHGKCWGRVGQTALGALMLEVYYRYYDMHEQKGRK